MTRTARKLRLWHVTILFGLFAVAGIVTFNKPIDESVN